MSLEDIVRTRIRQSKDDIKYSLKMIRQNNPFAAEPSEERRERRFQKKLNLRPGDAEALNDEVLRRASVPATDGAEALRSQPFDARRSQNRPEAIWGDTVDFVSVGFLEVGAQVARSVGRVAYQTGRAKGTGILIGNGLFLTNHHVIASESEADACVLEFDYERTLTGSLRQPTRFLIDRSVFVTDPVEGLDFSIFAVGEKLEGPGYLAQFGRTPLSDAADKHMIGEFANIIQHPQGRFKEVVLRENRLINRFDDALHYVADTEPGSSGSPVYNSEWQLIALHHWGGPWIDGEADSFEINEGIRASSIVRKLRQKLQFMSPDVGVRIAEALTSGEPEGTKNPTVAIQAGDVADTTSPTVQVARDGTATWTLPVELSVRIPALAKQSVERVEPTPILQSRRAEDTLDDYGNRRGYLPDFLPGFHVPLPQLGPGLQNDAARLLDPEPGANPFELKYHHFSVVMNKRRRLAFFTACMIDGKTAKSIVRSTRKVSDLRATDTGLREAVGSLDDAEADSWAIDPRIAREHYSGNEIYKNQKVPGYPNPSSNARIARMFQKGHLVRRLDPAWGRDDRALAAEFDTFHWTNAAPQVGFFNQGTADEDQPGTGRGNLWRAAENYVLRNAVAEDQRVISFTGPVFRDDDRRYRQIRIPGKFFKLTAWVEDGELRTLALLVDQKQVFDAWPEALGTQEFLEQATEAEAFLDKGELDRVTDFLSTVREIEELTELDFGETVRRADVRSGAQPVEVRSENDLPLRGGTPNRSFRIPGAMVAPDGQADDLTEVRGIGRALQRVLNENGIFHFRQIATWGNTEIEAVDAVLRFPGRIVRDDWVGQATRLAAE